MAESKFGTQNGSCDTYVNALKPHGDVWDECNISPQLRGDFPLMDVIRQAVGDDVILEIVDVVLWRWLGPSA